MGNVIIEKFFKKKRAERHEEMVEYAIKGGVAQAQVAHEVSNGNGRIHMNMLWELADSERILTGVLERAKGLINGRDLRCGSALSSGRAGLAFWRLLLSDCVFGTRFSGFVETRL